jgi:o-succinylbenzoate synthase
MDAEGRVGLGEATPLSASEDFTQLRRAASKAKQAGDVTSIEQIEALVADALAPELPASRYGLELALLDLLGQERGLPLSWLLNPKARAEVSVSALLNADESEEVAAEAAAAAREGYRTLKLKVGTRELQSDIARVKAAREAVATGVRIRLDANGAWSLEQAKAALLELRGLDVECVEQPVGPDDVEGLAALKQMHVCAVAADEAIATPDGALATLLRHGGPAADVIVLKPTVQGGLLPALRLARSAAELGVDAFVTHSMDGPLARAGAAHLAAAISQERLASGVGLGGLGGGSGLDTSDFAGARGIIVLPGRPGLGVGAP